LDRIFVWGLACLVAASLACPGQAQTFLTTEHVDIVMGWTSTGGWDLHVHDEDNDVEYEPNDAVLVVLPAAFNFNRPAGSAWDFLGVSAGTTLWRLPATQDPELLYLGIASASGVSGADKFFDSYNETDARVNSTARWIRLTLKNVSGPGHFAIFTESSGVPTVWMASADGIQAPVAGNGGDSVYVLEDGHNHYFYAFTAPGDYQITFEASGILGGTRDFSGDVVYNFQVRAVPEPGSLLLVGTGLTTLVARRRKNLAKKAATPAAATPSITPVPSASRGFKLARRRS
jgi:surface-anchored protein